MKKIFTLVCLAAVLFACKSTTKNVETTDLPKQNTTPADVTAYASTITEAELKEMLYVYASDEFKGRMTGEDGEKMAHDYLSSFYKAQDISSAVKNGSYEHPVPLNKLFTPEIKVTVNNEVFEAYDEIVSMSASVSGTVNANEIVYMGYGIDHEKYSDYANIDVKGKVVVARSGEPKNDDGTFVLTGTTENSKWSNGRQGRRSKKDAAAAQGAKAFIFIDDAAFSFYSKSYKRRSESGASLGLALDTDDSEMLYFLTNEENGKRLVAAFKDNNTARVVPMTVSLEQKSASEKIIAKNIAGFIEGSEKPEEYIVISAHLDHVGIEDGKVYNGADDDGSGTIAILEIAEAFKEAQKNGHGPKRSVVFLHVTGEERGLLGSKYYTDVDPIFPLENTVVNLNIDMIGRTDPKRTEGSRNYVYLIGSDKLSTELHDISEQVNSTYTNVELDYKYNDENDPNRFYYRSDHYNFAKNNIPVIFYFNGTHTDYHKPTDTPDKIEYDLLENRTKLIFHTAWELANRENRIVVDKIEDTPSGN